MSSKSWLSVFYPVEADDGSLETNLQRVQHSLQKWRGLRKEELKRHNIKVVEGQYLYTKHTDNFVLQVNAESCALCMKYGGDQRCVSCPLTQMRSGTPCDMARQGEDQAPWMAWVCDQNPEPMIAALEKAEARLLQEQARKRKAG